MLFRSIGLLIAVGKAAGEKGRNQIFWIITGIFFTPLTAFIALICLGESEEKRKKRILEEEQLKFVFQKEIGIKQTIHEDYMRKN